VAEDTQVLDRALFDGSKFPLPPADKYFLCDTEYKQTRGFMTPYRNVRYLKQRDISIACFAIHNFIRKENINDPWFAEYDQEEMIFDEKNEYEVDLEEEEEDESETEDDEEYDDDPIIVQMMDKLREERQFMVNLREEGLCSMNAKKIRASEFLIQFHEQHGDKITVIADSLYMLTQYAIYVSENYEVFLEADEMKYSTKTQQFLIDQGNSLNTVIRVKLSTLGGSTLSYLVLKYGNDDVELENGYDDVELEDDTNGSMAVLLLGGDFGTAWNSKKEVVVQKQNMTLYLDEL
nr:hypothetical protein [Tanacetum cinerariifolium]